MGVKIQWKGSTVRMCEYDAANGEVLVVLAQQFSRSAEGGYW